MKDWIIGVILTLFVIVPCWLALLRRQDVRRQVNAWPELARRTGLTFDPNIFNIPLRNYRLPGLRGEYRNRSLTVKLITSGDLDSDNPIILQNTSISLNVENSAGLSLSIQAKGFRDYICKVKQVPSGNLGFDRRFSATGSPREYVQAVVDRIVQSDPHLLAWMMRSSPSMELKGDHLTCSQNGELTNVDDQIAFLDLLCNIAELAEKDPIEVLQEEL